MDINKILNSDYLDLLFDGRNKNYGGYELRKKYPDRIRKAMFMCIGFVTLCVAAPLIANTISPKEKSKFMIPPVINITDLHRIDDTKPQIKPPTVPPAPARPTVRSMPSVVRPDNEVLPDETPPEQRTLANAVAGAQTQTGDPNGIDVPSENSHGNGTGIAAAAPEIFTYVEQQPEFIGNVGAYLQKNIRYPEMARQNNISGRVIVRFIVNEDGSVSDVQVMRSLGGGCDEEAKRVVAAMPKWKPGKQNNHAVKVYFTLPIVFTLE